MCVCVGLTSAALVESFMNDSRRATSSQYFNLTISHLCSSANNVAMSQRVCDTILEDSDNTWPVVMWLVLAQIFSGFAASGSYVLGVTYIDANAPKEKLPLYLGTFMNIVGTKPVYRTCTNHLVYSDRPDDLIFDE